MMTDTKQLAGLLREAADIRDGLSERANNNREAILHMERASKYRSVADELEAREPVAWQLRKLPDGEWMIPTPSQESKRHVFDAFEDHETRDLYATPPAPQVPDKIHLADVLAAREEDIASVEYCGGLTDGWNSCVDAMLAAAPQPEPSRPLKEVVEDFERNQKFAAAIKDGRIWVKSAPQPGEA